MLQSSFAHSPCYLYKVVCEVQMPLLCGCQSQQSPPQVSTIFRLDIRTYTMLLFCKWFCCICLIKMKHYEIIQFKRNVFYVNIFLNAIYSCDGKAEFLASITPVFSVTWSFRNISSYYQCIKPLWCLIFCFCRNVQVLHCHFWSV